MGVFPAQLAEGLRDALGLERAIETGAYRGDGARALAAIFGSVTSIEIDARLATAARIATADLANAEIVCGDSASELVALIDPGRPTLYWLDGHWSGGATGGKEAECPVMVELSATAAGNERDCILIDDARLFLGPPPPPHDPAAWPTFMEVYDTLRKDRPGHYITVQHDIVIAVPAEAQPLVDAFALARPPAGRLAFPVRALRRLRARI